MINDVRIIKYTKIYDEILESLSVKDDQLQYVGQIAYLLNNREDGWTYHLVLYRGDVVGFFNIDEMYGDKYEFALASTLGFRAFLIDQHKQGHGIGSKVLAILKSYCEKLYPERKSLTLTVNCKNESAYKLYLGAGFIDEGQLYYGGAAGPQHILKLALNTNN